MTFDSNFPFDSDLAFNTISIPVSTVPAVKAWLFAQLHADLTQDPGPPAVDLLVRYGDPGPYDPQDVVSVGRCETRTPEFHALVGSMGAGAVNEVYTIVVEIDVMRGGTDPGQAATTRAWALAAQVETIVRTDPTLGGNVIRSIPGRSRDDGEWDENHNYWRCHLEVSIDASMVI